MFKAFWIAAMMVACLSANSAHAQTSPQQAALQSPYVAKARDCLRQLATGGRNAGFETDWDGGDILVRDPTNKSKLGELLSTMFACLDAAFQREKEMIDRPTDRPTPGTKSWIWYAAVENLFVWCASDGDSTPEDVGRMGGHGPKQDWYAIAFQCSIGEKILGWYLP
jgi:hypothetical protein